jgi:hypothetical protein
LHNHSGNAIVVDGTNDDNGISMHPDDANGGISTATFDVPAGMTNFSSIIGMTSGSGNVNFRVLVDGVELFSKTSVTSTSDGDRLNIDVSGASTDRQFHLDLAYPFHHSA